MTLFFYFSVSTMLTTIQLLPHVFLLADGRWDASTVQTGWYIVLSLQRLGERGGRVDWTGFEAKSLPTGQTSVLEPFITLPGKHSIITLTPFCNRNRERKQACLLKSLTGENVCILCNRMSHCNLKPFFCIKCTKFCVTCLQTTENVSSLFIPSASQERKDSLYSGVRGSSSPQGRLPGGVA